MNSQEKIKQALERIEQGLATINTNEDWFQFLKFQASFYNYSFGNTMLIYLQNPEATFVKGFKAWHKLGRYVRKGEKGIAILAPCFRSVTDFKEPADASIYLDEPGEKEEKHVLSGFRITYVFDLAQTEGDDTALPVLVRGLAGNSKEEQELYEKLKGYISTRLPVEEVSSISSKGTYSIETGVIQLKEDLDYLQKIKTLLHEYSHHLDFKMYPGDDIPRNKRELVAESTAFVVGLRLGIDSSRYSVGYLKAWMTDRRELKELADKIQKIAATIINELAESDDSAFHDLRDA